MLLVETKQRTIKHHEGNSLSPVKDVDNYKSEQNGKVVKGNRQTKDNIKHQSISTENQKLTQIYNGK